MAVPIAWGELDGFESGAAFTVCDAAQLRERAADKALAGWGEANQVLPDL